MHCRYSKNISRGGKKQTLKKAGKSYFYALLLNFRADESLGRLLLSHTVCIAIAIIRVRYAAGRQSDPSVMEENKNPLIPLCQVAAAGNLSFEVQKAETPWQKP